MTGKTRSPMSPNNQASVPTTGEPQYSFHVARSQQPQDLTPYSAVSSFNLPARPDTNLYTPISMTNSPVISVKATTTMDSEVQIKLSPSTLSPTYDMFGGVDDDDFSPRFNAPMKSKAYSGLHISIAGSSLGPESPTFCASPPEPYFGAFGVSAPSKPSHSPPSTHPSPQAQPAGDRNSNNLHVYQQTSAQNNRSFRPNTQAPVLIAPNPQNLRPVTGSYRQNSLPSNRSPHSHHLHHAIFSQVDGSNSPRGKKGQKKTEPSYNDYYTIVSTPELRLDLNEQELVILDLRYKDGLQWKEVAKVYSQKYTKKTAVAALQMRRRRLMERLSQRAYEIAATNADRAKWEAICKQLQKYAPRRSSRELAHDQRKWEAQSSYGSQYDMKSRQRERTLSDLTIESFDHDSWSDGRESTEHSLHDSDPGGLLSAISSATMDDARSRAASDASLQLQLQQQQQQQRQQHQNMIYAQQQQHSWGPRQNS